MRLIAVLQRGNTTLNDKSAVPSL